MVAVLPARSCCAAICALGACIASLRDEVDGLSFPDFMALPDGIGLSLRYQGRIFHGVLGPCQRFGRQSGRKVKLDSNLKKWEAAAIWIFEHNLAEYQVSTGQRKNLSPQRQAALEQVELFYQTLDPQAMPGWCLSPRREVLVVASKAAWGRAIENVSGQVNGVGTTLVVPLADLLVETEEPQGIPGKTMLASSSRAMSDIPSVRVAILDGPNSIRVAGDVKADAVLMLIEHSECDEDTIHELVAMADVREDAVVPEGLPDKLPAGVEASVFGWRNPL